MLLEIKWKGKTISSSRETAVQFVKFCIIGFSNTFIQLGIYYLLIYFDVYYLLANIIAFVFSVLNSYFWNRKFTFTKSTTTAFTIVRLYTSYGLTTLLGTGLLYFFVDIAGLSKFISPIINICIITAINFFLNKYFIFRDYP